MEKKMNFYEIRRAKSEAEFRRGEKKGKRSNVATKMQIEKKSADVYDATGERLNDIDILLIFHNTEYEMGHLLWTVITLQNSPLFIYRIEEQW